MARGGIHVGSTPQRASWLDRYYQKYLLQDDSASFVANVASYYTVPVLEQLVDSGARITAPRCSVGDRFPW